MIDYKEYINIDETNISNNLDSFRSMQVYWFIHNGNPNPDMEADRIGKSIDAELFAKYLNVKKSKFGYKNAMEQYSEYDELDSRHYMMCCLIFNYLKRISFEPKNILEIGGGWGNFCYINQDIINYEKWTIIDLPHVNLLQNQFVNEEIKDKLRINLINVKSDKYNELIKSNNTYDLTICTHSLSEFDINTFKKYIDDILIKKTKYLLYCYHHFAPNSKELMDFKVSLLEQHFSKISSALSENNNVSNIIYINKKFL